MRNKDVVDREDRELEKALRQAHRGLGVGRGVKDLQNKVHGDEDLLPLDLVNRIMVWHNLAWYIVTCFTSDFEL